MQAARSAATRTRRNWGSARGLPGHACQDARQEEAADRRGRRQAAPQSRAADTIGRDPDALPRRAARGGRSPLRGAGRSRSIRIGDAPRREGRAGRDGRRGSGRRGVGLTPHAARGELPDRRSPGLPGLRPVAGEAVEHDPVLLDADDLAVVEHKSVSSALWLVTDNCEQRLEGIHRWPSACRRNNRSQHIMFR